MIRVRRADTPLHGTIVVPGDKSISHRALLIGALARGVSHIRGFLNGRDCHATLQVVRDLGVRVDLSSSTELFVYGVGLDGLKAPSQFLDCANSGTTMRLLAGLLAGQPFTSFLTGTQQLCTRPMARVANPLREMGATILSRHDGRAPLAIQGGGLQAIRFDMPVASAQVKSAVLLAGLFAEGQTVVCEPGPTRDHTERMLSAMGAPVSTHGSVVRIQRPAEPLSPLNLAVPADPSSAAFPIVAAACIARSEVELLAVGINPTRNGLVESLLEMGATIDVHKQREEGAEPVADLTVRGGVLHGTHLGGSRIVTMIDEIPAFAVAATQAMGTTVISDAAELRVKETDRIASTVEELKKMGARIEARPDGMVIHGPSKLVGTDVDHRGDHRMAMALAVAGLLAEGETRIHGDEVTADSFPGFVPALCALGGEVSTA